MKRFITSAAVLLSASNAFAEQQLTERALFERDLCASGSTDDGGNWYCQAVEAITYTGVGGSSQYNRVTGMDTSSGQCSSTPYTFSGNLAPFDEEVSLHFRGPLQLKQLAVYTPSGSSSKRDTSAEKHARHAELHNHAHAHAHEEREAAPEPAVGDMVTATINGMIQSWVNEYAGPGAAAATAPAAVNNAFGHGAPASSAAAAPAASAASSNSGSSSSGSSNSGSGSYGSSSSGGAWTRQGYYNSASGSSSGLTFLNHMGGSGSGNWNTAFGSSLSYAGADGVSGASSATTLGDVTIPSSGEVVVFTDKKCSGSDCGYYRDGSVAYHGFDGAEKIFLMEFGMPSTGESNGGDIYKPVDMPAIWMLNAQIPRTLQYGAPSCSCWTTGCGEFDIFEVLAPGDTRCKSTIHGKKQGGDSDYFKRPTSGTQKAAVIMHNNQFHIKYLDASTNFGSSMDESTVDSMISSTATQNLLTSLFGIA